MRILFGTGPALQFSKSPVIIIIRRCNCTVCPCLFVDPVLLPVANWGKVQTVTVVLLGKLGAFDGKERQKRARLSWIMYVHVHANLRVSCNLVQFWLISGTNLSKHTASSTKRRAKQNIDHLSTFSEKTSIIQNHSDYNLTKICKNIG